MWQQTRARFMLQYLRGIQHTDPMFRADWISKFTFCVLFKPRGGIR